jgi:hypothetical protein
MNPSVKDRLGSIVRALSGVVLPALPADASLAQEQTMLAIGHIQIILAQMDATPAFLEEEAADLRAMGRAIAAAASGGAATSAARAALATVLADTSPTPPEARTAALQDAIDAIQVAMARDGDAASRASIVAIITEQGAARADKDRRWFAAMGFDIDYSNS